MRKTCLLSVFFNSGTGAARPAGRALLCGLLALAIILGPVSPAKAFFDFTLSDEIELGRKFSILVKSQLPLMDDPEVKNYVTGIVQRLLDNIPQQPYTFEVNVLMAKPINAFAAPGGFIFVFTGLILAMDNESQLAGVLAHELAHVTQRHIALRIERGQIIGLLSTILALGGMFLGGSGKGAAMAGSMAAGQAAMLNYSRIDEADADHVGLSYLIAAGYRPQGMYESFENIRGKSWGGSIPQYLSTHPDIQERIKDISARVMSLPAETQNRSDDALTFKRIQTLVRAKYSDSREALAHFSKDKDTPAYLRNMGLGICYARLNRVSDAAAAFDAAVREAPQDSIVWREAGIFHFNKGRLDLASEYLNTAAAMNPDDYETSFYFARLLLEDGNYSAAFEQFKNVLRYLPESSETHFYYGKALLSGGQAFEGNLQLAYSGLYVNDRRKTENFMDKAKAKIASPQDQARFDRFKAIYEERAEFWDK